MEQHVRSRPISATIVTHGAQIRQYPQKLSSDDLVVEVQRECLAYTTDARGNVIMGRRDRPALLIGG